MVSKLPGPHDFRKLFPPTPHDLAMCVGCWWACIGYALCATVVVVCVAPRFGFLHLITFGLGLCIACLFAYFYFSEQTNHNALYTRGGVQLRGRIVERWEISSGKGLTSEHVRVSYQVGQVRYKKDLQLFPGHQLRINDDTNDDRRNCAVDLVLLPGYPKSAILYAPTRKLDPDDFLGSSLLVHPRDTFPVLLFMATPPCAFYCAFYWTVWSLEDVGVATRVLIAINFIATIVLGLSCGYKFSIFVRDRSFHEFVYGAKPADASEEDHILSYEEFCQRHHVPQYRPSYQTVLQILQIALVGVLWYLYYVAFLGCFLMWYGLAVPMWKRRLLRRYESESDTVCVVGSVTCKEFADPTGIVGVVVLYKADNNNNNNNRFFKKRLHMLSQSISNPNSIPDSLELVYLKGFPESAICKKYTLLDQDYAKSEMWLRNARFVAWGLFFMGLQIGIPIATSMADSLYYYPFLVVQFVMGFVGILIRYRIVIQWEILGGGSVKQVGVDDGESDSSSAADGSGDDNIGIGGEIAMLLLPDKKAPSTPTTDMGV